MPAVLLVAVALAAYLVGAVPFGFLVARWRGVNLFQQGSGNIGATNVGRVLGRRFGVLVFLLDFAKGALPVLAALAVGRDLAGRGEGAVPPEAFGVAAGLAAFLGHLFPVYLRFRGGKGVATGAGVVAVVLPGPVAAAMVCWVGVVSATRYVSLASLAAVLTLCAGRLLTPGAFAYPAVIITAFCLLAGALVVWRHRGNLARLLHGTENRAREGPTMLTLTKTVHVLALGLWFGTLVFFTLMASSLFSSFEELGARAAERPSWFPLTRAYAKVDEPINGPKEQGTRAAGFALTPLFDLFFVVQGVCGFLAVTTALGWPRGDRVQRVRTAVLIAALATVVIGWPLERYVDELRGPRHEAVEKFLRSNGPGSEALKAEALAARREFGLWHLASLALSFGTLILVAVALALAARLPEAGPARPGPEPAARNGDQAAAPAEPPQVATPS